MRKLLLLALFACAHAKPRTQDPVTPPAPHDETPPAATETTPPTTAEQPVAMPASFGPLYFDFDSAVLHDEARPALQQLGDLLGRDAAKSVVISGHTDERGTEEYNIALGDERARAARDYLVRLGVAAERIHTVSYGKRRPASSGSGEDAWSKNRRDEIDVK